VKGMSLSPFLWSSYCLEIWLILSSLWLLAHCPHSPLWSLCSMYCTPDSLRPLPYPTQSTWRDMGYKLDLHPSIHPYANPFIHPSIQSSTHPITLPSICHPPIHSWLTHPSIQPPTHPVIHLPICPPTYPLMHPPNHPLIYPLTHSSTHQGSIYWGLLWIRCPVRTMHLPGL
jgi:hypothetical protein